jgi:hypothetical protein
MSGNKLVFVRKRAVSGRKLCLCCLEFPDGHKLIHHDVDEDEREESEVDTDQGVHGHA